LTKAKVLSKAQKIRILKARFKKLNPGADAQEIDWSSQVGARETFAESAQDLHRAYPEFRWRVAAKQDPYQHQILTSLRKEANQHGFTVLRESDAARLRHVAKHAARINLKVKAPSHPKTMEYVHEYNRRWPRRKR
jgi:hypothetical protein